jgi:hypothetical protein
VDAGAVYVFHGPVVGSLGLSAADAKAYGQGAGDNLGGYQDGAGDVDGDGFGDVVFGAFAKDDGDVVSVGAGYLLHGPLSGAYDLDQADVSWRGEAASDAVGFCVGGGGDFDGDGFDDVVLGAWGDDEGGVNAGAAYVFLGPL